jgi:hypothetical protein
MAANHMFFEVNGPKGRNSGPRGFILTGKLNFRGTFLSKKCITALVDMARSLEM